MENDDLVSLVGLQMGKSKLTCQRELPEGYIHYRAPADSSSAPGKTEAEKKEGQFSVRKLPEGGGIGATIDAPNRRAASAGRSTNGG